MYKKKIVALAFLIILFPLFSSVVFSAVVAPQSSPVSPTTAPDYTDVITKIMKAVQKDVIDNVNKNVDENFSTLDQRVNSNIKLLFQKSVIAILGGMTVVLFGYAYVVGRITRKYEMNFYEKMMDAKLEKFKRFPLSVATEGFYTPVTATQFDKRHTSPDRYFDMISGVDEINSLKAEMAKMQLLMKEKGVEEKKDKTFYETIFDKQGKEGKMKKEAVGNFRKALYSARRIALIAGLVVFVGVMLYLIWKAGTFNFVSNVFKAGNSSLGNLTIVGVK